MTIINAVITILDQNSHDDVVSSNSNIADKSSTDSLTHKSPVSKLEAEPMDTFDSNGSPNIDEAWSNLVQKSAVEMKSDEKITEEVKSEGKID